MNDAFLQPCKLGTVDPDHISRQSELHCPLLPAASTHCSTLPDGKRGAKRACNAWCLSPPRIDKKDKPHAKITVGFGKAKAGLKNLFFFNKLPWAKARNSLEMLRLALPCGGVWLLTFEGGIQCTHRRTRFMYGNNLESSEQSLGSGEIRSSDHLVVDRPASMAVDMHGTWKLETPLSDAQSPVHAPLKPQNRMIRTRRGRAQGGCSWFCKQALPAATTVSSGRCQGSTAQFHAAPIQRRGICLETPGAPVVLRP